MQRKIISLLFFNFFVLIIISSCQSAEELEQAKYYINGMSVYEKACQNCHGKKGEGLGELVPPLTDTLFMQANRNKLASIIKNGTNEELIIHGKKYQEEMKGFPEMTDMDIAQVIVYITNSFGNKQGMYPYSQVSIDLSQSN